VADTKNDADTLGRIDPVCPAWVVFEVILHGMWEAFQSSGARLAASVIRHPET
jgi:hypothetical protein